MTGIPRTKPSRRQNERQLACTMRSLKDTNRRGEASQHPKLKVGVDDLSADAAFNFESYAECFVAENLVRRYIKEARVPLSPEARNEAGTRKANEAANKHKGNISIDVRRVGDDLSYLSMDFLAHLVDAGDKTRRDARLIRDADEFKPMRDAVAHTALLTDDAKTKLRSVRQNIKARVKTLLSDAK